MSSEQMKEDPDTPVQLIHVPGFFVLAMFVLDGITVNDRWQNIVR
jgi:hypothetical protein